MNNWKTPSPPVTPPGEDSGMFELAALVRRYDGPKEEDRDDLTAPAWSPGPVLNVARSRARAKGTAWLVPILASAMLFAVGGVSVAYAAVHHDSSERATLVAQAPAAPEPGAGAAAGQAAVAPSALQPTEKHGANATTRPVRAAAVAPPAVARPVAEASRRAPRRARRAPSRARPAASSPSATPAPAASADARPAYQWNVGGPADSKMDPSINALLDSTFGGPPQNTPAARAREDLPDAPTARQVQTTLRALEGEVHQCADSGNVTARVVVDGATGHVTSANVQGSPAAVCMEQVLRTARFPRFRRDSFTVSYPYRW